MLTLSLILKQYYDRKGYHQWFLIRLCAYPLYGYFKIMQTFSVEE